MKVYVLANNKRHFDWWLQRNVIFDKSLFEYVYSDEQIRGTLNPPVIFLEDWEHGYRDPERMYEHIKARMHRIQTKD